MVYNNLNQLGNNILKYNDIVCFCVDDKIFKYRVEHSHLYTSYNGYNSEIFSILGINKYDFCTCCYGYRSYMGDWPICRHEDYAALTRVVKALYQEIEHKKAKENIVYLDGKNLLQELRTNWGTVLSNPLLTTPPELEKKEDTSSNILVKRKSKIKRIIGEEPIKLNNY